jgi:polar amino acid transport system substrate-binding protein
MNRKYTTALFIILSGLLPGLLSAQNLIINSNDVMPRSSPEGTGYEDRILKEAFRRVGATFDRITVPSARALILADQGAIDGDYVRIDGIDASYPNLVRVGVPIATMDFSAFTIGTGPYPTAWADLASIPFAHIIGWKIVEQNTVGFRSAERVRDPAALFAMLMSGKVRTIVYDRVQGMAYLKEFFPANASGSIRVTTIEKRGMYLYLNARHRDLARRLEAALTAMEREGLIASITAEVEGGR